jgi:hypothetical protein
MKLCINCSKHVIEIVKDKSGRSIHRHWCDRAVAVTNTITGQPVECRRSCDAARSTDCGPEGRNFEAVS